jgi:peroxiredoxin
MARWQGKLLPDLAIQTLDGKTLHTPDFRGRPLILNFWATWCPPCRAELPHFQRFAKENASAGVAVVGISDEPLDVLRPFVAEQGLTYPIGNALSPPAPFNAIEAWPTTVVVDAKGIIRKVHVGYCSYEKLKAYVEAAAL